MNRLVLVAAIAAGVLASPAVAQSRIVDQSAVDAGSGTPTPGGMPATSVSEGVANFTNLGQSFTPTLSSVNFATFQLLNDNETSTTSPGVPGHVYGPSIPVAFDVSLYSGFGTYNSSTLLGTSLTSVIAPGYTGKTEFDFLGPIALTPGQMYTFIFNDLSYPANPSFDDGVSAQIAGSGTLSGDAYTRGRATFYPAADFVFSEGIFGAAAGPVPEPASWAMMFLGIASIGFALRRRTGAMRVFHAA